MKSYLLLLCLIFSIQVKCEFNLIDFSDDHKMVVFCHASDTVIHYYNRDHNVTREISPGIGIISKISVTAAKLFIAKGSYGKLFIFDAVREKTIGFISGVNDFIVSDDRLIYGTRNGEVVFLHLKSFETKRFTTHYGPVAALALKNDNSALAIAGDDGSIKLLDMKKYVINAENVLETGNIQGIAFNESGNRLFISVPNVLYEWNSHLRFSAVYDCSETGKLSNFEKEIFIVDAMYSYGMEKNLIRLDKKYIINVSNEPFAQRKGEILFISHYGDDFITACIYDRTKEPRLGVNDIFSVSA